MVSITESSGVYFRVLTLPTLKFCYLHIRHISIRWYMFIKEDFNKFYSTSNNNDSLVKSGLFTNGFHSCKWKSLANHLTSDHCHLRCIGRVRYCDIPQIHFATSLLPIIIRRFLRTQRLVTSVFPSPLSYHSFITGSDLRSYHRRACLIFFYSHFKSILFYFHSSLVLIVFPLI